MLAVNPVIELVKVPVPVPSVVWLPVATGFAVVAQHTPRADTVVPPSADTFPPDDAVVAAMDVGVVVVNVGSVEAVPVIDTSSIQTP